MEEMIMMMATVLSEDNIVGLIEESINEYREAILLHNEENVKKSLAKMRMNSYMLIIKGKTGDSIQEAMDLVEEFKSTKKAIEILKPGKQ